MRCKEGYPAQMVQKVVVGVIAAVPDPSRHTPREPVRLDRGIAALGLRQQPEFVPAVVRLAVVQGAVRPRMHVRAAIVMLFE